MLSVQAKSQEYDGVAAFDRLSKGVCFLQWI